MKINQKLAALFVVSACALSTQVSAQESALDQIVSNYVNSAVESVSDDIDVQLQKSFASAANMFSLETEELPTGKVTITDLVADTEKKTKESETKLNQKSEASD